MAGVRRTQVSVEPQAANATEPEAELLRSRRFPRDGDVRADLRERYGYSGDLGEIYASNRGAAVHKLHHYLPIYERYFAGWRGKPVRFLEIGVWMGGSLQMWRRYLGPQAVLYGIDIDPKCADEDGKAGAVRIGDQSDSAFLRAVVEEMGGLDVVLDDGSHRMDHIRASLAVLFPLLAERGTYMIEDLACAYWPSYGGGYGAEANFFNMLRELTDDMHAWYHGGDLLHPAISGAVTGIHVHDSIAVLEKGPVPRPVYSSVGAGDGRFAGRTGGGLLMKRRMMQEAAAAAAAERGK
jgi:methyltransferase family protein